MKPKLILTSTIVAFSLWLFACSPALKQVAVDVSCDGFTKLQHISKEVELAVGDSFTVTLCSNPSTGREWELPQITDQTMLEQVDHKFVSPEYETPPPPGTPAKEIWTFKVLKEGESTIFMEWSQPWESGVKAEWTFALTVVVKLH